MGSAFFLITPPYWVYGIRRVRFPVLNDAKTSGLSTKDRAAMRALDPKTPVAGSGRRENSNIKP